MKIEFPDREDAVQMRYQNRPRLPYGQLCLWLYLFKQLRGAAGLHGLGGEVTFWPHRNGEIKPHLTFEHASTISPCDLLYCHDILRLYIFMEVVL